MDNKLYICRNCQYVFPKELSELIESEVQVYCEMCGTPFSLLGVSFKQVSARESRDHIHKPPKYGMVDKEKSSLDKAIRSLNKFDNIPLLIFSIITIILSFFNFNVSGGILLVINSYLIMFSSLLIFIYNARFISPRIKSKQYDEITLDAICYGILGCFIYGTGVIILIKGILIFVYSAMNSERGEHRIYQFGLKLKNSLNNFSAKAGFVILLLVLIGISFSGIEISAITIITSFFTNFNRTLMLTSLILISLTILIIDLKLKKKMHNKTEITGVDVVRTFILGVLGTIFLNLGIFILLKSILLLILFVGKPIDLNRIQKIKVAETEILPVQKEILGEPKLEQPQKEDRPSEKPEFITQETIIQDVKSEEPPLEEELEELETVEEKPKEEIIKDVIPQKKEEEQKEEIKLRLHESLLPVKNEKDRKIVKEYFSKIFNIISKDLRAQILELDIPRKERKSILKELAFLAEEEQLNYIVSLRSLYVEIPKKLIERIQKLPNVKSKYYDKIVEELKYLDGEEQIKFLEFLEKHA